MPQILPRCLLLAGCLLTASAHAGPADRPATNASPGPDSSAGGLVAEKTQRQKQRVENRAENTLDQATDKAVDKVLDKAFGRLFGQ